MKKSVALPARMAQLKEGKLFQWYSANLSRGQIFVKLFIYVFLSVVAFVFVYPFLYMVITSTKSVNDLYDLSVNWIPRSFHKENYTYAWKMLGYPRHFLISAFLTGAGVTLKVLCCSFIGYGFARYKFFGKNLLFFMAILSIIMPVQTILLPQYLIFANLQWTGSYLPLLVPQIFGYGLKGGLFIFLFRQFFLNLPTSLEEAARIDGCGSFKTFWRVALPTVRTSVVVTVVLAMVWHWNDYYEPSIYLNNAQMLPLPSMLPQVKAAYDSLFGGAIDATASNAGALVSEGTLMAAIFLVVLPVLIVYAFLQKKFMQGIERSGLGGD
ncbi:MAG: carbohydrate ABC transporter permease [Clostridia bacterium]|nr:carbohydrate ABC transporter permease [Clostridia bacterium]